MSESKGRNRSLLTWIAFAVASVAILVTTSSLIHSAPGTYSVTPVDEVGGALPFALFAALVTYYVLKPRKVVKPELRETGKAILRVQGAVLLVSFGIFLAILYFILTFLPLPGISQIGGMNQMPSGEGNPAPLPILNPVFLLSIFMIGLTVAAVLIGTFLRTKPEMIEDVPEEEGVVKGARLIPGRVIDDECRRAVIASYVQGREILASQGVPLNESTTPREFEDSVLESAETAGGDFVPLTRLFEEARFSVHPVGAPEKTKAEKHYEKLAKKQNKDSRVDDS